MIVLLVPALLGCAAPAVEPAVEPTTTALHLDPPTLEWTAGAMRFETLRWTHGAAAGVAWLVSFPRDAALEVRPSAKVVPFTALLPDDAGPWAAVNGGFYEQDAAMGLVVSGGVVHSPLGARGGSGVLTGSPRGISVLHRDAWRPGPPEALQSIDRLIDGGKPLVHEKPGAPLAARTAVAIGADRVWLVATAGAGSIEADNPDELFLNDTAGLGLSLSDFAALLREATHAEQAINLDGAVSTQLAVHGDGHHFLVRGERGTINAVVLRP